MTHDRRRRWVSGLLVLLVLAAGGVAVWSLSRYVGERTQMEEKVASGEIFVSQDLDGRRVVCGTSPRRSMSLARSRRVGRSTPLSRDSPCRSWTSPSRAGSSTRPPCWTHSATASSATPRRRHRSGGRRQARGARRAGPRQLPRHRRRRRAAAPCRARRPSRRRRRRLHRHGDLRREQGRRRSRRPPLGGGRGSPSRPRGHHLPGPSAVRPRTSSSWPSGPTD